jgi:hypothetical protein
LEPRQPDHGQRQRLELPLYRVQPLERPLDPVLPLPEL